MVRQILDRTHQRNDITPPPTPARPSTYHPRDRLTPRQLDVLTLLYHGLRPQAIADELGLTVGTVRSALRDAYSRLGVLGGFDALARARARGLFTDQR